MAKTLSIRVENLPKFKRLYEAVHAVLVARLLPPHEIPIEAWDELLSAHDDIANQAATEEGTP